MTFSIVILGLLGFLQVDVCLGHGRLMSPPSRNAMWRFGYPNPVNYNDNEIWCGGFGVQYDKNGGKCGVCGDNWADEEPREHEAGGKFGNGIITKRYTMGQKITVEVDLSANHWGYFELKVCPVNNRKKVATQECMDKYPLYLADDPSSSKFFVPAEVDKKAYLIYDVLLPQGLVCSQCVMQWTYFTGNTWGDCGNGTGLVGCGFQETFRNCADIQIFSNAVGLPPNAAAVAKPNAIYFRDKFAEGGRRPLVVRYGRTPLVVRSQVCVPTKEYEGQPNMEEWCQTNCLQYPPNCPKEKCTCLDECVSQGDLQDVEGAAVYCHRNCLRYPSTCPKDRCACFPSPEQPQGSDLIIE